jgi:hypothetical protein
MFVRFRQTQSRLRVSLVETRRADGRVRHEHIASLGSIKEPPTVEARLVFWRKLHERLGKLSNRIGNLGKIMIEVHARIPMVTLDEQRDQRLDRAERHERLWTTMCDNTQAHVDKLKAARATIDRQIAEAEANREKLAAEATTARNRIERIKAGEDVHVPRVPKMGDVLREAGWTNADMRHAARLSEVCDALGDDRVMKAITDEAVTAGERAKRAFVRRLLRYLNEREI